MCKLQESTSGGDQVERGTAIDDVLNCTCQQWYSPSSCTRSPSCSARRRHHWGANTAHRNEAPTQEIRPNFRGPPSQVKPRSNTEKLHHKNEFEHREGYRQTRATKLGRLATGKRCPPFTNSTSAAPQRATSSRGPRSGKDQRRKRHEASLVIHLPNVCGGRPSRHEARHVNHEANE